MGFNLTGKHGLQYALALHGGLHSFMRNLGHILFIETSKQATFFLTRT